MTATASDLVEPVTLLIDRVFTTVEASPRSDRYLELLDHLAATVALVRHAETRALRHTGELRPVGLLREPLDRLFSNREFDRRLWNWLEALPGLDPEGTESRRRLTDELRCKGAHLDDAGCAELRSIETRVHTARRTVSEVQDTRRPAHRPLGRLANAVRQVALLQKERAQLVGSEDEVLRSAAWVRPIIDRIQEPVGPPVTRPVAVNQRRSIPMIVDLLDGATAVPLGARFEWLSPDTVRCRVLRGDQEATTTASVRFRAAHRPRCEVRSSFTPIGTEHGIIQLWFDARTGAEANLREALSFAHELGHLLHQTTARSRYANLSGVAGAPPWARELPSKLLEALLLDVWDDADGDQEMIAALAAERAGAAAGDARAGRIELDLRDDPGGSIVATAGLLHLDAATCFSGSDECWSYALGFAYSQNRFDELASSPRPIDALAADCTDHRRWAAGT